MKVIHIESGLGNQMLSYCEYLALRTLFPEEELRIETIVYDIEECNQTICQWNGYELERVFGIKTKNIRDDFDVETWSHIVEEIKTTKFWQKNWNWPVYFSEIFSKYGLHLSNRRGNFEDPGCEKFVISERIKSQGLLSKFYDTKIGEYIQRQITLLLKDRIRRRCSQWGDLFPQTNDNFLTGQRLAFKNVNQGIEAIEKDIRGVFRFPELVDIRDQELLQLLKANQSVAVHARRGDMLGMNGYCYKYGYFKRATRFIKKHIDNPYFIFFTDSDSVEWCKNNLSIFGLSDKDLTLFVDWHKGTESFRDMQLMSLCRHAIITNSSFGWFGSYLIDYKNKITISPIQEICQNTTHHL